MVRVIPVWKKFHIGEYNVSSPPQVKGFLITINFHRRAARESLLLKFIFFLLYPFMYQGLCPYHIPSNTDVHLKRSHDHTGICCLESVNTMEVRDSRGAVRFYFTTIHPSSKRLFCWEGRVVRAPSFLAKQNVTFIEAWVFNSPRQGVSTDTQLWTRWTLNSLTEMLV